MGKYDELLNETSPTVIVLRKNTAGEAVDVRIDLADFDPAVDVVSPDSHRVPEVAAPIEPAANTGAGNDPAANTETPVSGDAKPKGKGKKAKPEQVFTITVDGLFYLSDDKGNKLNETGFKTAAEAAAAPVTVGE